MKKTLFWLLAVVITLVLSIYQRMTGPTYPKKVTIELNGAQYKVKLPRSGVLQDEIVALKGIPQHTDAQLHYRRYPTSDDYTTVDFKWTDSEWQAALPVQPVAGKLQYYITVDGKDYLTDPQRCACEHPDTPHHPDVCCHALCRLYLPAGGHPQEIQQVVEGHGGNAVRGRFHLRPSRATCGFWPLVGRIPIWNRPD